MSCVIIGAQRRWEGSLDDEGHRSYQVTFQTMGTAFDGPQQHLITPGLPTAGAVYAIDNDIDVWAWCTGADKMSPRQGPGEVNLVYDHTFTFTTNARGRKRGSHDDRGSRKKCSDVTITNPLAEPPKRSGGTTRNQQEKQYTRYGLRARNTAFQPVTGPQATFDESRDQVVIEFNDVNLNYATYKTLVDTVNRSTMWGLPARCWKLSEWHWEWKLYGVCLFYVTHRFVFESNCRTNPTTFIAYEMGNDTNVITFPSGQVISDWDRYIPDVSTVHLRGHYESNNNTTEPTFVPDNWGATVPNYTKPFHYIAAVDQRNVKTARVVLSRTNRGWPAATEADELIWCWREYAETDFLTSIPFLPSTL